jgi:predicted GNAT superfamily acetyltransferase
MTRPRLLSVLLAGDVPHLAVLILAAGAFALGRTSAHPQERIAVAEKGAVVMEAVLQRPGATSQQLDAQVREPILGVLQRYASRGYAVIDVSRDQQGAMAVAALPMGAVDITGELRTAVGLPSVAGTAASAVFSGVSQPATSGRQ